MKKLKYINYKCFNCNYTNKFNKTIFRTKFLNKLFTINLCIKCNCSYTNSIPANKFTWSEIYKYGGSDQKISKNDRKYNFLTDFFFKLRNFQIRKIEKLIIPYLRKKKLTILDYGVGDGYISNYFNKDNNKVFACDINSNKPLYLHKNVKYFNSKEISKIKTKFDLILLRHVLEHCPDPKKYIKDLSKKISKRGIIYVEVPNHCLKSNIFLKIFKNYYAQLCLPHHINHFSKESFYKTFDKDFKLSYYSRNIPVLGASIQNIIKNKEGLRFGALNIILYPLQILISILTKSDVAFGVILQKK